MASSPYDPAQAAAHDRAAALKFPGPCYYTVLEWIHEDLKPAAYVEIGVGFGCSLAAVRPPTAAIGIDPCPALEGPAPAGSRIFRLTSNEFFARHDPRLHLGGRAIDFALIDGLHLFEQALRDVCHLERFMAPGGMVAVHDTIPLDRQTSARARTTEFYTGDVWKIVPCLRRHRPELEIVTVATAPSGLTLIRGFDPRYDHTRLLASAAAYTALDYDWFERRRGDFLRTIPNHRAAVRSFCQKTPVQSMASSGAVMPSRHR